MQEIIDAFGIDWRLIVIQVFNFALLLALLWYFLYKPVLNLLDQRQKKIAQGVRDAEASAQQLAQAEDEKGAILKKAHEEAEAVVLRAREHAEQKGSELLAAAQEKSARTLKDAEMKAKEAAERARKESEGEIARVAILAAEKVLRERS